MAKDTIPTKLKRIQGQIAGVQKMYESDRPCIEVVRQIVAVRNSLGRVAKDVLADEAGRCAREQKIEDLNEIIKELLR